MKMKKDKMFSSLPKYDAGGRVKKYMGGGKLHNNMMNRMGMYKEGGMVGKKLSSNPNPMNNMDDYQSSQKADIQFLMNELAMPYAKGGKVKKNKKY